MTRRALLALALCAVICVGSTVRCVIGIVPSQNVIVVAGFAEPHTPGSGAPEEFVPPPGGSLEQLLGASPDLNQIQYVRTSLPKLGSGGTRAVLILIPGFLGGATTFDPLARDLVAKFNGNLEVWAVDRRPNQLEDRLGATYAVSQAEANGCGQPAGSCSGILEGAQFYFADTDVAPLGDFPGPGDLDVNLNGSFDAQLPLDDGDGARLPILFTQDELRAFQASWGLDTYFRDWKILVEQARALVGPDGVVLMGGHSQGTTWASTFAAYDFDPDPSHVVAGYSLIDGLVLIEGGGVGTGQAMPPTRAEYDATVASLETPGGPDVFLESFSGIPSLGLGTSGEVSAVAASFQPDEPALIQRTPVFGSGLVAILLGAPATNEALVGLFLDDDFSPIGAFRASIGFTDDGPNSFNPLGLDAYVAGSNGGLRTWKDFDDPAIPSCAVNDPTVSPGCADVDNGPEAGPADSPPIKVNGVEREVTAIQTFIDTQFGKANGFEWYFTSGRVDLDFSYGRDSSSLVAQSLVLDPSDEGPLVVTQNADVNVPVLAIGGRNGLTPQAESFASYLGSIGTPAPDQIVVLLEGYAHLDPLTAADNEAVPPIVDFVSLLLQRALLD